MATGDVPKSGRGKTSIDRREFKEAWNQRLVDWGNAEEILEKDVDNYHEMEHYEAGGEKQVNNEISECQLTDTQYKLTQGRGKYSSEGTKKIIEQKCRARENRYQQKKLVTLTVSPQGEWGVKSTGGVILL